MPKIRSNRLTTKKIDFPCIFEEKCVFSKFSYFFGKRKCISSEINKPDRKQYLGLVHAALDLLFYSETSEYCSILWKFDILPPLFFYPYEIWACFSVIHLREGGPGKKIDFWFFDLDLLSHLWMTKNFLLNQKI